MSAAKKLFSGLRGFVGALEKDSIELRKAVEVPPVR
jgi:hypothetical protein